MECDSVSYLAMTSNLRSVITEIPALFCAVISTKTAGAVLAGLSAARCGAVPIRSYRSEPVSDA